MPNIKTIDLRRGQAVQYKSGIWVCVKNDKVAKGNWRSSQVIQLKNFQTGQLIEERFRTDEIFELAMLERKPMKYLYSDSKSHIFMDMESFEETHIDAALVGDESVYLVPDLEVTICTVEGKPVLVELPNTVELTIQDTPPELKGRDRHEHDEGSALRRRRQGQGPGVHYQRHQDRRRHADRGVSEPGVANTPRGGSPDLPRMKPPSRGQEPYP